MNRYQITGIIYIHRKRERETEKTIKSYFRKPAARGKAENIIRYHFKHS